MTQTQEELRKQALAEIINNKLDKIDGNYFGKLIFEIRAGRVYQVRTEQTTDVGEEVSKLQKPPELPPLRLVKEGQIPPKPEKGV